MQALNWYDIDYGVAILFSCEQIFRQSYLNLISSQVDALHRASNGKNATTKKDWKKNAWMAKKKVIWLRPNLVPGWKKIHVITNLSAVETALKYKPQWKMG